MENDDEEEITPIEPEINYYDGMDVLHTGEKNPRYAPPDSYNLAFILIGILGMGALYPWNFFITAADYFHYSFRNTTQPTQPTTYQTIFENALSIVATSCGVIGLFINTILTRYVSFRIRIYTGFLIIAVIFTITTVLATIDTDTWQGGFFAVTIVNVLVINLASACVNSGICGVQGCLPSKFSTSMMVGQAVAGVFAALASVFSVLSQKETTDRDAAIKNQGAGYFGSAVGATVVCTVGFAVFTRLPIVNYYLQNLTVENVKNASTNSSTNNPEVESAPEKFQLKLVLSRVWPLASTMIITLTTTLAVFPAVVSSVRSLNSADGTLLTNDLFLPVACFLLFNTGDFAGKLTHGFILYPNAQQGVLTFCISLVRTLLIPLFMFCNAQPRQHQLAVVFGDAVYVILLTVLGFSNGYLVNLAMMYGPKLVPPQFAETTGSIMALCLNVGLMLGSALSFALIYAL